MALAYLPTLSGVVEKGFMAWVANLLGFLRLLPITCRCQVVFIIRHVAQLTGSVLGRLKSNNDHQQP